MSMPSRSTTMLSFLLYFGLFSLGLCSRYPEQYEIVQNGKSLSSVRDILLANAIIPEVLDDFEPIYHIDIAYPKHHDRVLLGNDIKVKHVQKRPTFTFYSVAEPDAIRDYSDKNFTLVLTDPDALSRDDPSVSEMCHWIVTNLTSTPPVYHQDYEIDKKDGEIIKYLPPSPPPKKGVHRYVFVLLEGNTKNIKPPTERKHWGYGKIRHGVRDWAEENGLKVVGANFFLAQNKKQ